MHTQVQQLQFLYNLHKRIENELYLSSFIGNEYGWILATKILLNLRKK